MSKRSLDLSLIALTVAFLVFVVVFNEDPGVRVALFGDVLPETTWHAKAIYKALYDIGMGGLVSVLFYLLLVRIPENSKRRRIRRSLEVQFRRFKQDCLYVMLGTVNGSIDPRLADELLDQKAFRSYFKGKATATQDRWDVFLNNIDENELSQILRSMEILREEINFALGATDVPTDDAFNFLKRLSIASHSLQRTELGYDTIKPLSGFLWTLFSGFDIISGYQEEDVFEKMIRSI
ncbi:hypothetical protein [Microvirga tunisiensis]|uniref:DUF4760 domain-containing protein n=1 Tax=Microvirga tunisiensis TaxID=2108360 RepID=A0A5N7MVM2_9HYPH|nr:hypothetical protein [Microvirga tunisiensis]MPR13161.1 hypothetical protein [Microvirga tunisiensis]MPR31043.1 hypothetical protein [Microvirga tunisiensis]